MSQTDFDYAVRNYDKHMSSTPDNSLELSIISKIRNFYFGKFFQDKFVIVNNDHIIGIGNSSLDISLPCNVDNREIHDLSEGHAKKSFRTLTEFKKLIDPQSFQDYAIACLDGIIIFIGSIAETNRFIWESFSDDLADDIHVDCLGSVSILI